MVLMNLFSGQQWRCRHREQTCALGRGGVGRKERVGRMKREVQKHIHHLM